MKTVSPKPNIRIEYNKAPSIKNKIAPMKKHRTVKMPTALFVPVVKVQDLQEFS